MKVIQFSVYYVKLHLSVALGFHHTSHPLDLHWRWRLWQQRNDARRN